jgi:hypothetical protein
LKLSYQIPSETRFLKETGFLCISPTAKSDLYQIRVIYPLYESAVKTCGGARIEWSSHVAIFTPNYTNLHPTKAGFRIEGEIVPGFGITIQRESKLQIPFLLQVLTGKSDFLDVFLLQFDRRSTIPIRYLSPQV